METPSGRALWGTPRRSMARAASVSDRSRSADTRRYGWAVPPDGGSVDDGPVALVNVAVMESSSHTAPTRSRHDVDPGGPAHVRPSGLPIGPLHACNKQLYQPIRRSRSGSSGRFRRSEEHTSELQS